MALESVRNILKDAQKYNTSVIAFDACDYHTIEACIRGAEMAKKPVNLLCSIQPCAACSLLEHLPQQ